jgi:hypothetical protein
MENIMSQYKWYYKAKLAAEKFLPALDNNLDVDVEETSITPYDGGDNYTTYALVFTHDVNPNLSWTMEVQLSDEFIERELEKVVRRIYFSKVE